MSDKDALVSDSEQEKCGHCGLPIHPSDPVHYYGWFKAHHESRCRDLLQAEIKRLSAALTAQQQEPVMKQAVYWLIERGSPAEWLVNYSYGKAEWTTDSKNALRGTQEVMAKLLSGWNLEVTHDARITEHIDVLCDFGKNQRAIKDPCSDGGLIAEARGAHLRCEGKCAYKEQVIGETTASAQQPQPQQESVAWIWDSGTNRGLVFTPSAPPDYENVTIRPLIYGDTAPPSGVREGMLRAALERIAKWHGEFPATGRKWDDGTPMSYYAAYGSNGERDYMRKVASDAITAAATLPAEQGVVVPVEKLQQWRNSLSNLERSSREYVCGIRMEMDDLLRAAQEGK